MDARWDALLGCSIAEECHVEPVVAFFKRCMLSRTQMSQAEYSIRPVEATPDGVDSVYRLLSIVWKGNARLTPEYLVWLYRDNPAGAVVGFNAFLGTELAAHYATVPIEVMLFRNRTRALLSLNTATHPAHQGKRLFTKLADQTYEHGANQGFECVVGVANANSTPGFVRKLGFAMVSPLQARLGIPPLRSQASTLAPQPVFERIWTRESFSWRLRCPSASYTFREDRNDGSCQVIAASGYPLIGAAMGRLSSSELCAIARRLPRTRKPLWVWIGIDQELAHTQSLFVDIPKRLRPSPLNFIFKPLSEEVMVPAADQVKFSALDFDAY
jgi:GNAT superfamily N-acetyltransferase